MYNLPSEEEVAIFRDGVFAGHCPRMDATTEFAIIRLALTIRRLARVAGERSSVQWRAFRAATLDQLIQPYLLTDEQKQGNAVFEARLQAALDVEDS